MKRRYSLLPKSSRSYSCACRDSVSCRPADKGAENSPRREHRCSRLGKRDLTCVLAGSNPHVQGTGTVGACPVLQYK